jgi:polysaccharide deacetylase 2 family uncharacterized protein YibQ
MDEKLEEFLALLNRPPPRPARPRTQPRPPVPAAARLLRRPAFRLPRLQLPLFLLGRGRLLIAVIGGMAGLAALAIAAWLALPRLAPAPLEVAAAPPAAAPVPDPHAPMPRIVLTLPPAQPEPAPDEQAELNPPDEPAAVPPPPPPAPAAVNQVAALPRALPRPPGAEPAWLRFAVPAPAALGKPQIAIVIDDLGLDKRRTERAIALPGPLTLSFLAYASDLPRMTEEAHRHGHELLVHVPMEPMSRSEDMGPNGLAVGLAHDEVLRRLRWDLERFDGYVGINNHMGSRFTSSAASMLPVMEELKARGLLFLDSRTIGNSAGVELARKLDVPHAARDVFLDNEVSGPAVAAQLVETEQLARRHGSAIAIGHPHDATLDQLAAWLTALPAKGFVLVPVSTIVKERRESKGEAG